MSLLSNRRRNIATLAALAALAAAGPWIAPPALNAWTWLSARGDPAALTHLGLKSQLTPERLDAELRAALDADDVDLAAGFLALADQQGLTAPAAERARYLAATTPLASARRGAGAFYDGVVNGNGAGGAGLAGVIASDLTGIADARDALREGGKIARGEEPDRLALGLAVAGLALTGATIASVGVALPARAGVSAIKAAAASGRLSKPLAAVLTRQLGEAIDAKAVTALGAAAARLDVAAASEAAQAAIRPAALTGLRAMAGDVAAIGQKAGVRGAQDALAIAQDAGDLKRLAALAETRGIGARGALKILGRGAIALTAGVAALAGWTMAGIGYLWLVLLVAAAIGRRVLGGLWWTCRGGLRAARRIARRRSSALPSTSAPPWR